MAEPTNSRLLHAINADVLLGFIGTGIVTAVIVGIAWGTQANEIEAMKQAQQTEAAASKELRSDVGQIKTDVEVIKAEVKNNREQYQRQFEDARRDRENTDKKLDEILRKLSEE